MHKPKIAFIGTDWNQNEYRRINNKPGAVSQYRLITPKKYLTDFDVTYFGSDFAEKTKGADPVIAYSNLLKDFDLIVTKVIDNSKAAGILCFISKHYGIPLVIDIDDNVWEIKEDQPAYKHYGGLSQHRVTIETMMTFADAIFCSTKPLADYIKNRMKEVHGIDKHVVVLPNTVDRTEWEGFARTNSKKVVIGWQGSTTHNEDFRITIDALARVMQEHKHVHLEILGGMTIEGFRNVFSEFPEALLERVNIKPGVPAWDNFPALLRSQRWDIGIAPITDDLFNHSKSHIKWLEYSMVKIPTIASKVYPYYKKVGKTDTIQDGITGLLADQNEWYEKLTTLVTNEALRKELAENAYEYVTTHWNAESYIQLWEKEFKKLLK